METCCEKLRFLILNTFLILFIIEYEVTLGSSEQSHGKWIISHVINPTMQNENKLLPRKEHPRRSIGGGSSKIDEGNPPAFFDFDLPRDKPRQGRKTYSQEVKDAENESYVDPDPSTVLERIKTRLGANSEEKNSKMSIRKKSAKPKPSGSKAASKGKDLKDISKGKGSKGNSTSKGSKVGPTSKPDQELESCPEGKTQDMPNKLVDNTTIERIHIQNRHLTLTAHKMAIFGPEIVGHLEDQEPTESFKILNKTGEIFKHYCPTSVIPTTYIDNVVRNFMVLHQFDQPARTKYLTPEETSWILKLLDKCHENTTSEFVLNGQCADEIIADMNHKKICPPPKLKGDHTKFDVLIDTLFKIFELTHSHCFESFQGYSRVWHRYVMGIEDLFTLPIKQRWGAGPNAGSEKFWMQLLGPNFIAYNENIDKCVHFYAMNSPLKLRLQRFYEGFTIRYGANVPEIFGSEEQS